MSEVPKKFYMPASDSDSPQPAGKIPPDAEQCTGSQSDSIPECEPEYISRNESRLMTPKLRCCKGRVADITGSGMRMIVSPKDLPEIGDVQEYTFSDGSSELIVSGTVKWVRKGPAFTRRSEVGVEFEKLDSLTRDAMIKFAVQGKIGEYKDASIQVQYPDLYKLLGITPYASQEQIDSAYRQEAKRFHPDHNDAPNAAQQFDQLHKAYSVLGDPEMRSKYDARFFNPNQKAA